MANLIQRVQKLESVSGNNNEFLAWLRSLSDEALNDTAARSEVEIELKVTTKKPWHPCCVLPKDSKYAHTTDAELLAELDVVKKRNAFILSDEAKAKHQKLKDKWRTYYLSKP